MTSDDKTGTILVAIDGSRNSMLAAGVGARMARLLNAHLGLIHVLDVPALSFWVGVEARMKDDIRNEAEAQLTEIADKMATVCNVVPEFYIVEGIPEEEIVKVANANEGMMMVIAGRHGVATEKHSHLKLRRAIGHLAGKLGEHLHVPLLVVPPDVPLSQICPALAEMQPAARDQT